MTAETIEVTDSAVTHFLSLIEAEESDTEMNLRLDVKNPGTADADVQISFCPKGEESNNDASIQCGRFVLFIAKDALLALKDASIGYVKNETGGQLSIKAPHLKGKQFDAHTPFDEKITYLLETEVAPNLASHGGFVKLVKIEEPGKVFLQLGGGCQGCGMAKQTLQQGIERLLKARLPEIKEIIDVTDHASGSNPFY